MIHFDNLPTESPVNSDFPVLPAGRYKAEIIKAEIRQAKESGNEYLNLQLKCTGADGTTGTVFDKLYDSEKPLLQFKMSRFLRALPNTIAGDIMLQDLPKIVQDKTVVVAIVVKKQDGYKDTNEVDIFDPEIYTRYQTYTSAGSNESNPFDPRTPEFDPDKEGY